MTLKQVLSTLKSLTPHELQTLRQAVNKLTEAADSQTQKKATLLEELHRLANARGYTLEELLRTQTKTTRAKAKQKYCNPGNPHITWSGRGRKPKWFIAAMLAGKQPEDLYVRTAA